jgi:hypothetical protein
VREIYLIITISYLHKATTYPTILPCAKVVATRVQQVDVANQWLKVAQEKPLTIFKLKVMHEKYDSQLQQST